MSMATANTQESEPAQVATAAGSTCRYLDFELLPRFAQGIEDPEVWNFARQTFPSQAIPKCTARDEEEFEKWIEEFAEVVRVHGYKMGDRFLIDRLITALSRTQRASIDKVMRERDLNIEDFIDLLAKALFPEIGRAHV